MLQLFSHFFEKQCEGNPSWRLENLYYPVITYIMAFYLRSGILFAFIN